MTIPLTEEQPKPATYTRLSQHFSRFWLTLTLLGFMAGAFSGYAVNEQRHLALDALEAQVAAQGGSPTRPQGPVAASANGPAAPNPLAELAEQVNPTEGYTLPAVYGDIGPRLIEAGAFEYEAFVAVYAQSGRPLGEAELAVLQGRVDQPIVITRQNSYFLLNLLWAFGLTNQNRILTEGPMVTQSGGKPEGFASTGGWSLAAKPLNELYSSTPIVTLTEDQQVLVEKVAAMIYRPCCNNPTHFPDCNHGMAMLGLLELMAAQGATEEELLEAAKYVNAFWYPNQYLELAVFFKAALDQDFADIDPATILGPSYSSGSGYQSIRQALQENNLLPQAPGGGGGSCGV